MRNAKNLLLNYTRQQIASFMFQLKHKTAEQHFTRESPLGFERVALIILNLVKKSAKVELMNFFHQADKALETPSRQAFTQAREKISFLAIKDFFEKSCELAVNSDGAKLYNGYRLFAIDGTSFIVGKLNKLASYFGESTSVKGSAMCRISGVIDIMNDCIVDALVSPFSVGERALAISQVKQLSPVSNALFLFDRGYWSPELVAAIITNGQKFLMRLASNVGESSVSIDGLRKYSFSLPSGKTEILLTNLTAEEMPDDELAYLYGSG